MVLTSEAIHVLRLIHSSADLYESLLLLRIADFDLKLINGGWHAGRKCDSLWGAMLERETVSFFTVEYYGTQLRRFDYGELPSVYERFNT